MKQIFKFVAYLICYVFYPFSYLFPRTDKILVFGSYRGGFNDNSKYLFLYANKHIKDRKLIWISTKKSTVAHIRSLGFQAYYVASFKGLFYALRSGYWFVNSYTSDIGLPDVSTSTVTLLINISFIVLTIELLPKDIFISL